MGERLQQAWLHRGLLAWLLWPVSLLMRLIVAMRRSAYALGLLRSEHPGISVIVVGNVVAGGAGKTPTVIAVVRHLQSRGHRPGVVSRGYGRASRDCREVAPDSPPQLSGDEPLLVRRATGVPVFVAARRLEAARALLAAYPETDVIVCDDGLQHLALRRDLEICVFDERGAGNGFLLPAGPLREPWPRAVDLVLNTFEPAGAAPAVPGFTAGRALADHALRGDGSRVPLQMLRGRKLLALAGIARPHAFFQMLQACGVAPVATQALPDHYDFSSWSWPSDAGIEVICTEKDALKLWPKHPEVWAVPLELTPEPAFFEALDRRLDATLSSRHGHQTS
ncbi:MAG: tetraacyldisaccharide 4'-kinase [Burkholderiaceae bacterium]|jgi:tetraacyldisaccharide 4'-kinase